MGKPNKVPLISSFFQFKKKKKEKENTSTEENVRKCMLYCVQPDKEAISRNENNKSYS